MGWNWAMLYNLWTQAISIQQGNHKDMCSIIQELEYLFLLCHYFWNFSKKTSFETKRRERQLKKKGKKKSIYSWENLLPLYILCSVEQLIKNYLTANSLEFIIENLCCNLAGTSSRGLEMLLINPLFLQST